MTTTATTGMRSRMTTSLDARRITLAGVAYVVARMSVEQLAGQAAGQVAGQAGSDTGAALAGRLPLGTIPFLDWMLSALAISAHLVDGWTQGLAGTGLELVSPFGGPVWAGVIPLGATLAAVRRAAAWIARHASDGSSATSVVPTPRGLLTAILPPSAWTRSSSPSSPVPFERTAPPTPSSDTVSRTVESMRSTRIRTRDGRACLAALVRASDAT